VAARQIFCERLRLVINVLGAALTMPFVNPHAGPFRVEVAEMGDTLAPHFVEKTPARDRRCRRRSRSSAA
jgi:hypothetical protein